MHPNALAPEAEQQHVQQELHGCSEVETPLNDSTDPCEIETGMDRFVERLGRGCAWLVLIAMLISVYEVVARYVFDSPTTWVHETTTFLVAAIFVLGGPYTLARNRHIRIQVLAERLSASGRRILGLINLLLGIGFCSAIGYAAWILSWKATHTPLGEWRLQTSGSAWNSPLPTFTKILILLAVMLMAVQMIVRFRHALLRRRG